MPDETADLEATSDVEGKLYAYVDNGATVGTVAGAPGGLALTAEDTSTAAAEATT